MARFFESWPMNLATLAHQEEQASPTFPGAFLEMDTRFGSKDKNPQKVKTYYNIMQ